MSKQDLQKETLDRIGRKLLEAASVRDEEIEKIVAAPHLFDSVRARIKAETPRRTKPKFFVWNLQTASGTFAVLIVLLAIAAVIFTAKTDAPQIVENQTPAPEIPTTIKQIENQTPAPEITKTKTPAVKNPATQAQKTDFKENAPDLPERARKPNQAKSAQSHKKDAKAVFYPLAFGGNWEADGEDLQIVRAELSRAELFALGINLPVENESVRVKTDLLVGADGVARAIRFVE
jgi:hypothetical protein